MRAVSTKVQSEQTIISDGSYYNLYGSHCQFLSDSDWDGNQDDLSPNLPSLAVDEANTKLKDAFPKNG